MFKLYKALDQKGYVMARQKGFTLIELLVVIAVIAVLLTIITPALNKARLLAEDITCRSNIRQYMIATEMYSQDYDEHYPYPWETIYAEIQFSGEVERFCRWHNPAMDIQRDPERLAGPYWPYLNATDVNICPTFRRLAPNYGGVHYLNCIGGTFNQVNFSYAMNGSLRDGNQGIRKTRIASPSRTFLWAEENMWRLRHPNNGPVITNHVLNDTALLVPSGDGFASFHGISSRQLQNQQPDNPSGHGEYNTGESNVLMVDGSVRTLTPPESHEYVGTVR